VAVRIVTISSETFAADGNALLGGYAIGEVVERVAIGSARVGAGVTRGSARGLCRWKTSSRCPLFGCSWLTLAGGDNTALFLQIETVGTICSSSFTVRGQHEELGGGDRFGLDADHLGTDLHSEVAKV